jgi:hypothetical protein
MKNAIQTLNEEIQTFPKKLASVNFVLSNKNKKSSKKNQKYGLIWIHNTESKMIEHFIIKKIKE